MDLVIAALAGGLLTLAVAMAVRRRPTTESSRADGLGTAPVAPALLQSVFDALQVGAVLVDADDDVVLANPAAVRMGVTRGARLASNELIDLVGAARTSGAAPATELELTGGDEPHSVDAVVALVGDDAHVVLLLTDITEAHRVDAVRRDFVANVSHELKTPVGALSLLAEAILDAGGDDPDVRRFAERMRQESERLARLVQELIDLSRLQGAEPTPKGNTVAVSALLREAADRVRLAAEKRGIELVVGDADGLLVWGDAEQLATALGNLLDNAVAYSAEKTRVGVGARLVGEVVEIAVSDQGIGISAEDMERIFERFYRVDPARSRATGGTGLGLAIVKHIATNHRGHVTVWSAEGSGSTFTLHLPAAAEGVGAA